MTDEIETYTLRKPVTARETGANCMQTCLPITYGFDMEREDFDEWFVKVSVQKQQLREQLRKVISDSYVKPYDDTVDAVTDEIVAVVESFNTQEEK